MAETWEWVAVDGAVTTLDVDWSVSGRFSPPTVLDVQRSPGRPGATVWGAEHDVAKWSFAHWVDGVDEDDLRDRLRQLVRDMDPRRGAGRIRVTAPGGDRREQTCRITGGLGVEETLGVDAGIVSQRLKHEVTAHDPYWYAADEQVMAWSAGVVISTFFPFFPLRLTASETLVDEDVVNSGDVDAWPVWQMTGPFTSVTAENLTTGRVWTLTTTTTNPQTVTVDTRPGAKTVTRDDGTPLFAALSTASRLWPLAPGTNRVRVSMGGASAASAFQLGWVPGWLAP